MTYRFRPPSPQPSRRLCRPRRGEGADRVRRTAIDSQHQSQFLNLPSALLLPPIVVCLSLIALAGVSTPASAQPTPLPVVTTTTDLRSLAEAVGGARVAVTSLVPPGLDPEEYQPRPQDLAR